MPETHFVPFRVLFVLGAGASVPAGIPTMPGFTHEFAQHLQMHRAAFAPALPETLQRLRISWDTTPYAHAQEFNLEVLYEMLYALNRPHLLLTHIFAIAIQGLTRNRESELLEFFLKGYIQQRCLNVSQAKVQYLSPILKFQDRTCTLRIATLNYDRCIEVLAEGKGHNCCTGFNKLTGHWNSVLLEKVGSARSPLIRLLKLHGSATWYEMEPGRYRLIDTDSPRKSGIATDRARSLTLEGMLIYPGVGKQPLRSPFLPLFNAFRRELRSADICIALGYRFADTHVRDLVIEALQINNRLKMLVVAPDAEAISEQFIGNSGPSVFRRVYVLGGTNGLAENALPNDRLLCIAQEIIEERPSANRRSLSFLRAQRSPSQARYVLAGRKPLTAPTWGVALNIARQIAYVSTTTRVGRVISVDIKNASGRTVSSGFRRARGLALGQGLDKLLVVENEYRGPDSPAWLQGVEGVGRVWRIDLKTGTAVPVTKIGKRGRVKYNLKRLFRQDSESFWHLQSGLLRWPSAVKIAPNGAEAYVTEARRLSKISLTSGVVTPLIDIPLAFNLYDIDFESTNKLLVLDSGVWDVETGIGRIFRVDLIQMKYQQVCTLRPCAAGLACISPQNTILISYCYQKPHGTVAEVDLNTGNESRAWPGLDSPRAIAWDSIKGQAFVGTQEGLIRISL